MSQILQTLYASAPNDDFVINTLELKHPAFHVDGFPAGFIRLAQGYGDESFNDLQLGLETGETATFKPCALGVRLPKRSVRGQQNLAFQLDNVSGEALRAIDAAQEAGGKIIVIFRVYIASNLSQPAESPYVMTASNCSADYKSLSVNASFHDLVNKAWPTLRYTPAFAPGLKYFG